MTASNRGIVQSGHAARVASRPSTITISRMAARHKKRHVYALFENRDQAFAAYEELQRRGSPTERCSVVLHRNLLDEEELTMSETAVREGAKKGTVIAGVAGALIAGLIAIPGGLVALGPLAAAAMGGAIGAAWGSLLGAISGASAPEKALREIEKALHEGKVLVAVETDDPTLEQACSDVLAAHGGEYVE